MDAGMPMPASVSSMPMPSYENKEPPKKFSRFFYIPILNILKYIILKEKVEKVFFKCPKIAAKSAELILFAAPIYIAPTVKRVMLSKINF